VSHTSFTTRLFYRQGREGLAKLHGKEHPLTAPPSILGLALDGIDYVPEVAVARIQERCNGWRDMTIQEIRAADTLLRQLVPTP